MIYELYEMHHSALSPWRHWAELNAQVFGSPFSLLSYIPSAKKVRASCEMLLHVTQRYDKPDWGLTHTLVGRRSGQRYRLGDRVRVQIVRVDLQRRQMDFRVVG